MFRNISILVGGIAIGALFFSTTDRPVAAQVESQARSLIAEAHPVSGLPESPTLPTVTQTAPNRLAVVWTSGDRDVALKMVFMYVYNGARRGWWDEIQLIVWGPSSELLSVDVELQEQLAMMQEAGVEVVACRACAEMYDVDEKLEELGVEVKYMGVPLTEMLQGDWEVVTF